jgi:exopolysaccharide production protein ExoY
LRKSSVDELPQLYNVIRGDMSLVGPRPIVRDEIVRYGAHIEEYLRVRPGLTGLWQVSGRSDISYQHRVVLDVRYVREWSLWRDFVIIFKTIPALLRSSGSY